MWTTPASAPWSNSSGSRTSSTTRARRRSRSRRSAVSISVISAFAAASRSRNVAMRESLPISVGIRVTGLPTTTSAGRSSPSDPTARRRRGDPCFVGSPLTMTTRAPAARPAAPCWRREHRQRRPDGEQHVAPVGGVQRPSITSGTRFWPNVIVSLLTIRPPHDRRRRGSRVGLARPHTVERLRHRPPIAARPAPRPAHRAVHLDHALPGRCRRADAVRRRSG